MKALLVLAIVLVAALGLTALVQYLHGAGRLARSLEREARARDRARRGCDGVRRLPAVNRAWRPAEAPASLEDAVRDLTRAGGVLALAGYLLERQLDQTVGYGRAGDEIRMAVRYALNAALHAWRESGAVSRGSLRRTLVRSIRDAARLFREERDDDEGLGAATFHELAGALAAGSPVRESGLADPLPAEGHAAGSLAAAYDARRWDPGVVAAAFDALPPEGRRRVIARQGTFVAYVDGVTPTSSDHRLFLATLLARDDRFREALTLCRRAMEDVTPFVEAFRPVGPSPFLYEVFRFTARDLSRLVESALASDDSRPLVRELASYLASVALAREGSDGPGYAEAHAVLDACVESSLEPLTRGRRGTPEAG